MAPNSAVAQPIRSERSLVKLPGDWAGATKLRGIPSALSDRQ